MEKLPLWVEDCENIESIINDAMNLVDNNYTNPYFQGVDLS